MLHVKRMRCSRCSLKKQVFNVNKVCFKCLDFFSFLKKVLSTRHVAARPTVTWGKQSDANLMFEVFI